MSDSTMTVECVKCHRSLKQGERHITERDCIIYLKRALAESEKAREVSEGFIHNLEDLFKFADKNNDAVGFAFSVCDALKDWKSAREKK